MPATYGCSSDEQCRDGAEAGWCEADGYCSFADDACPDGRRYGGFAPGSIAGACVEGAGSSSDASGGTTTNTPALTSETSASATTGDTSTGDVDPSTTGSPTSSTGESPSCDDWWDCAWTRRQSITVARLTDDPLANFPVPVPLEGEPAGADDDDATSLRFVAEDGSLLPYEREADIAWVFVPTLPAAEIEFDAYFLNPDAEPVDGRGLWSDYAMVLHGADETDATGVHVGTGSEGLMHADGVLGPAFVFDGASVLEFPPDPSVADLRETGFTVSFWMRPSSDPAHDNYPRIIDKADTTEATRGWTFALAPGPELPAETFRVDLGMSSAERRLGFPAVAIDEWNYVAFSVAKENATGRYNDMTVESTLLVEGTGSLASDADTPLAVGASAYDASRAYVGELDELRLVRGTRTDAWLAAEYAAGLSGAVTLGPVEVSPLVE